MTLRHVYCLRLPFDHTLAEIDHEQLRRAMQEEQRHMEQKRMKRVESLTSGIKHDSDGSSDSEILEELHEHALGSSDDSSDAGGSVYGRRGDVQAGSKRMRDPLLRSRSGRGQGWQKELTGKGGKPSKHRTRHRGRRRGSKGGDSPSTVGSSGSPAAMAHQLLMMASSSDSDEEEAGGDAFNASLGLPMNGMHTLLGGSLMGYVKVCTTGNGHLANTRVLVVCPVQRDDVRHHG